MVMPLLSLLNCSWLLVGMKVRPCLSGPSGLGLGRHHLTSDSVCKWQWTYHEQGCVSAALPCRMGREFNCISC